MTQEKKPPCLCVYAGRQGNPDRGRRVNVPGPQASREAIQKQFEELLSPAIYARSAIYRSLNLRKSCRIIRWQIQLLT